MHVYSVLSGQQDKPKGDLYRLYIFKEIYSFLFISPTLPHRPFHYTLAACSSPYSLAHTQPYATRLLMPSTIATLASPSMATLARMTRSL